MPDETTDCNKYWPIETGILTVACWGFVLLMAFPALNRLQPWGDGLLPDFLVFSRDAGIQIYAIKSAIAAIVAGIAVGIFHNMTLRTSLSSNTKSWASVGFAIFGVVSPILAVKLFVV